MKIIEPILATILSAMWIYRGYVVHNYLRNKQGLSDIKLMDYFENVLDATWTVKIFSTPAILNQLIFVIPFFSPIHNPEIKRKQLRINFLSLKNIVMATMQKIHQTYGLIRMLKKQ